MVPLGSVATFHDITGPDRVEHFNLFPSADIRAARAGLLHRLRPRRHGARSPQRLCPTASPRMDRDRLPGAARRQRGVYVFLARVLFVFLLLAAQYESWALPLAVILIVPMCLLAAIGGCLLRGMDINIFTQIGFVVLVGLAGKNAILIVEFAKPDRGARQGPLPGGESKPPRCACARS